MLPEEKIKPIKFTAFKWKEKKCSEIKPIASLITYLKMTESCSCYPIEGKKI